MAFALTKSEVPSSEVRSYFCNGNLSNSPKILRRSRRVLDPYDFDKMQNFLCLFPEKGTLET